MFIFALFSIYLTFQSVNSPIYRDVSLKGGLSAIIETNPQMTTVDLQTKLMEKNPDNSFVVSELSGSGKKIGYIIDTDMKEEALMKTVESLLKIKLVNGENYNANTISETLSDSFFKQAIFILLISFVLMSIVVFLYFKEIVPSFAVVLSAIFDILVTIGILNLLHFRVSISGVGAIIMLIGYSIDTDVLLTNRLIKEPGKNYVEKTFDAFKTGSLMSFTTLVAGLAAIIVTNSNVIFEISFILVLGLLVDYISTWIQNSAILLWWLERRDSK